MLSVGGATTSYRVSTAGASLVGAEMRDYRSLAPATLGGGRPVELAARNEALLSYRVVIPGDTLVLSRTLFTATRPVAPSGARNGAATVQVVQLDGVAQTRAGATVPVQFVYSFVPDSFVAHLRGTVGNVTGPAYLLVDLPARLQTTETDSLDHLTHLAYAYKRTNKDAKAAAFSRLEPGEREIVPGPLTWAVAKSKYFLVGALAPAGMTFTEATLQGGVRTSKVATHASGTIVQALNNGGFAMDVYAGPLEYRHLTAMGRDFENVNPYGGWLQGVVQPFATFCIKALFWMHDTFALSYGWVLVLFGVIVRLALWPLQQGMMRTQVKMQRLQPELQAIQTRHKGDPAKLQQEMTRLYAAHGMSPLAPVTGCLPMLIPLPIFFALFHVFQNTIEFRGVPFLYLPDISIKDPFYVMPVLVAATQFLLSWIGMRTAPAGPQMQQQKMMAYVMPAVFLFFFLNLASGLNLYYLTQNLIMIPQQWLIARERKKSGGSPPVEGTPIRKGSPLRA